MGNNHIDERFKNEVEEVLALQERAKDLFSFRLTYPQALCTYRLMKHKQFFNTCPTGTGKSAVPITAASLLGFKNILVISPKSVMQTWKKHFSECKRYSKSEIAVGHLTSMYNMEKKEHHIEVLNYDRFNRDEYALPLIQKIISSKIYDMIVLDEGHRLKNKHTTTSKNIELLLSHLLQSNPNLYVNLATATPTTTNIGDVENQYTIVTRKHGNCWDNDSIIARIINASMCLETSGFGYEEESIMQIRYNGIDSDEVFNDKHKLFDSELTKIDGTDIEADIIKSKGKITKVEECLLYPKYNAYKHLIKKGTLIYTEYTDNDDILFKLKEIIENRLGLSVAIHSGQCKWIETGKRSIDAFVSGEKDVLICTRAMCEGVDGIQKVCNRLILHNIPTVYAMLQQIVGRVARKGSSFVEEGIDVFVPMVEFKLPNGKTTSFDRRRWWICMTRKAQDEGVKRGNIEVQNILEHEKENIYDNVINKLEEKQELLFKERVKVVNEPKPIAIPQSKRKESYINRMNKMGRNLATDEIMQKIDEGDKEWLEYQEKRKAVVKKWEEQPPEYIAKQITDKKLVIGDFGCGTNDLAKLLPNKVYGFDFNSTEKGVINCDMAHTPLADNTLDVGVFSMSIDWSRRRKDYAKEAHRVIKGNGLLYVALSSKPYPEKKRQKLIRDVENMGFRLEKADVRKKFFYLTFKRMPNV